MKLRHLGTLLLALALVFSLFAPLCAAEPAAQIKNIIVMIPDGGGFGNCDLAEALKLSGGSVPGQRTAVTTDAIEGEIHESLYLSSYLVGTSRTRSADSEVTDSAAGGTAIATGHRTDNHTVALTSGGAPIASLLEACQLKGMATGLVTTSTWHDATPAAFGAHAADRGDTEHIATQMLRHDIDLVLGGSNDRNPSGTVTAADMGYTVVEDAAALKKAVESGTNRIWSNFTSAGKTMDRDWKESSQPTILEMTQAAIRVLSKDSDGFFLMVEGGCVDKGAHSGDGKTAAAEYLAFDEAFAYAVDWAKKDGQTIVVAVPDHDTGGLDAPDLEASLADLRKGTNPESLVWNGRGGHTGQNVGIWLYAPEGARETFLTAAGLPAEGAPEAVRSGTFYSGTVFNEDYATDNCNIAPAIAAAAGLDLEAATAALFVPVPQTDGVYRDDSGFKVTLDAAEYTLPNGITARFPCGIAVLSAEEERMLYLPAAVKERIDNYAAPFTDVTEKDWFAPAARLAYAHFLMDGTAPGLFAPELSMSRAMLVTVLWRYEGAPEAGENSFADVPDGAWYTGAVAWAAAEGVVNGVGENKFDPDGNITREQMAAILYRYCAAKDIAAAADGDLTAFPDGDQVSAWAKEAVQWTVAEEIIGGSDGSLLPRGNATRAQVATMLMRFIENITKQ